MGDTRIEWTDKTWNPCRGCSILSPGCANCYAMRQANRLKAPGQAYHGLVKLGGKGPVWTGEVNLVPENLFEPFTWRESANVFVNSMSDLFHEEIPFEYIAAVFGVMAATPRHTYQVLTKRADRMLKFFEWLPTDEMGPSYDHLNHRMKSILQQSARYMAALDEEKPARSLSKEERYVALAPMARNTWPIPNVHLGVSVESQKFAEERIPYLLKVPAAVRFLSCEPLLGPLDLQQLKMPRPELLDCEGAQYLDALRGATYWSDGEHSASIPGIDWVIVGGESGHGARPMHPAWVQGILDGCVVENVPFFFKQWGSWGPIEPDDEVRHATNMAFFQPDATEATYIERLNGKSLEEWKPVSNPGNQWMQRYPSKKGAGRELNGRTWDEMPVRGSAA